MSSPTEIFEEEVYDTLCKHGPLRTRDILSLVYARRPDLCISNWKHDVHNAQQVLQNNRQLIVGKPLPERPSWYLWEAVEL